MGLAREYSRFDYSAIWTLNAKKYIPNKSFSFKYYDENTKNMESISIGDNTVLKVEMYIGGEHSDFLDQKHTASCQLLKRSVYDHLLWTCKLYNFGLALSNTKNITVDCGFNFLFDTGSNILWVPSANCTHCRNYTKKYNPLTSSTSKNLNIQIKFYKYN